MTRSDKRVTKCQFGHAESVIEQTPYNVKFCILKKIKKIGDVFSSYLVIFPATLSEWVIYYACAICFLRNWKKGEAAYLRSKISILPEVKDLHLT